MALRLIFENDKNFSSAALKQLTSNQKYTNYRDFFTRVTTTQESAVKTSYAVALIKAKTLQSDGKIVKRCAMEMMRALGEDNLLKNFNIVSPQCDSQNF